MIGPLISAATSIFGGLLGSSAAKDAREAANAQAMRQEALQREFAQSGIQWRVEDAKKAGVHPLYALGAQTPTYSPVSQQFTADTSLASGVAAAGQDIGRAINSTRNQDARVTAFNDAVQKLSLEKMGLENEVLRADLASKTARLQQQINPPLPTGSPYLIPGQTASGPASVKLSPFEQTPPDPHVVHQEPGANPDVGHLRTSGGLFPVPGQKAKEAIEDNWYQETAHFMRNNLLPTISPVFNQPPHPAPEGKAWVYDPVYGYKLVNDKFLNRFFRYGFN